MSQTSTGTPTPNTAERVTGYLLPKPPGKVADLVVAVQAPGFLRHRESAVARSIGERAVAVAECQQHLFGELRECLAELGQSVGEATRVRMQTQLRSAQSVLEWCEAVLADQLTEARLAASGLQPVDVAAVCEDVAERWRADGIDVAVAGADGSWWGDGPALEDAVDAGLRLVRERARGAASLSVDVHVAKGHVTIAIDAVGEPNEDLDVQVVDGFREAVARVGGTVRPGRLGRGGAGLVLVLPDPTAAAVVGAAG